MTALVDQFNHGEREQAIQAAVKAIDAHPDDPKGYATLAAMLIAVQAYLEATQLLTKALALFPEDGELRYANGVLQYAQGQYEAAVGDFLALHQAPSAVAHDATYMLALTYKQLGQPQKALAFAITAQDQEPSRIDAAVLAGELLLSVGAFADAATRLAPLLTTDDPQVLFTYGLAQSGQGQDGSAYLERAKAVAPEQYAKRADQLRDIAGFLISQGAHDER